MGLEEHSAAMCMSSSATLRPAGFDEKANPPQGGDAKPGDPRGQPSYRTIGNVHVQNTRAGGPPQLLPLPAQVRARVRRPGEIQEATHWLFAVLVLTVEAL